jgi:tetratricopeptide (TPR) repeat protein
VWYWQNSRELFTHAIAVSKNNYMACVNLGDDYVSNGEEEKAMTYYREALRIAANYPPALNGLGKVFFSEGRVDEALGPLEQGVRGDPKNGQIRYNLGYVLLAKGRVAEALEQFQQQVDLTPDDFSAQKNFADVLLQQGLADDAMTYFQKAAEIRPHAADPHYKLGSILLRKGRAAEAVAQFEQALQIQPDNMQSCSHLAWALATSPVPTVRQGARAVELALRAGQLAGGENPQVLGILAAAYAEAGRFPEAVTTVQRARQLALAQTNSLVADVLDQQLKLYQAGLPFRDNSGQGQGNQK